MKKIQKQLRIYFNPIYVFIIALEVAVLIIISFYIKFSDPKLSYQLAVEASLTFLAAFTGIFIPVLINRNLDKEKDRRTMAFTLGLIWDELIINESITENLIQSYKFDRYLTISPISKMIDLLLPNHEAINALSNKLQTQSYVASQSSGAISTIDSDEIFNALLSAYENIVYTQVGILTFTEELKMKHSLEEIRTDSLLPAEKIIIREQVKVGIENVPKELNKMLTKIRAAKVQVNARLELLDVKVEEI